jgi:glycosyltransferase involved in cell wall biosynthesis
MQAVRPSAASALYMTPVGRPRPADAPEGPMENGDGYDLCVNTQTPLLQFGAARTTEGVPVRPPETARLSDLEEGVDYQFSPGGVTRMVYPLLRRLRLDKYLHSTHWVALNPFAPETVFSGDLTLHNVRIAPDRLAAYGNVKETIWGTVHGLRHPEGSDDLFWSDDFSEYAYYNRLTAETIRALDARHDFDLFYIHDFQQLAIGEMLGTLKPKLFRWHIPFDAKDIPESWRPSMTTYLNSYDTVIVSTDKYLAQLKEFGYAGRAVKLYPYVDPSEFSVPPPDQVRATVARWGIEEGDTVALVVARMDPMKGQDRAMKAVAQLAAEFPRLKLLLVGNGSFSSAAGGLGLSKGGRWRHELEALGQELGIADRIRFTGHVSQPELDAAYERCALSILPSAREGFGLVVVESWLHGKPTVVSRRAGIAELVKHRKNGMLVDPENIDDIAARMRAILADPDGLGRKLGEGGRASAEVCTIDAAARAESLVFGEVVAG